MTPQKDRITVSLCLFADASAEQVAATVDSVLSNGDTLLWLTDNKGRRVGVPTDKIAYVEVAGDAAERRVGFGSR